MTIDAIIAINYENLHNANAINFVAHEVNTINFSINSNNFIVSNVYVNLCNERAFTSTSKLTFLFYHIEC